ETRTRLFLVIHRAEDRKSTNTGRLAAECLANSQVLVRGNLTEPSPPFTAAPDMQPVLLFPHEHAVPLTDFAESPRPVVLVIPEGAMRHDPRSGSQVAAGRIPRVRRRFGPPTHHDI